MNRSPDPRTVVVTFRMTPAERKRFDKRLSRRLSELVALAVEGDESLIRSVRVMLTLRDPLGRVRDQVYSAVAAVRNRLE